MNLERKKEETMKKKIIIAVAVIVILAAGGTFYLNHKINSAVKDGKIIKGVSCEGISIGGMTRSEHKIRGFALCDVKVTQLIKGTQII